MTAAQDSAWPLPAFYFRVEIAGQKVNFAEVNGIDLETMVEYRDGDNRGRSPLKMPGLIKPLEITLKKGVFKADSAFREWAGQLKSSTVYPEDVIISLIDEKQAPVLAWKLHNAWPTGISGIDIKPGSPDVAVETVELACEQLTSEKG